MNTKKKCSNLEEALETWKKIPLGKCKFQEGDKYNRLTIVYRTNNQGIQTCVVCKCNYGNYTKVRMGDLKNGHIKSCGCLHKELISQKRKDNLIGQKFGKLTILSEDGDRYKGGSIRWKCQCECGNICYVSAGNLKSGQTQSCGCLGKSKGEYEIAQILRKNNISFIKQKTFDNCRFKDTNCLARFDFYVDNKYLIEYDGSQHFQYSGGWNTKENYLKTKEHDEYKNQWCKENNIPLIRIPYTHYNNLCLEDLVIETTKWRVV